MDSKHRVKLSIYDQALQLRCTSPDEMYRLARLVDERMRQFAAQYERISVTQLAILTALSMAGELADARQMQAVLEQKVSIMEKKLSQTQAEEAGQPRH